MHQSFSSHSSAKLNQASDPSRLGKMCGVAVPLAPSRCFRQQSASTHRGTPNAVYSLSWQSNPGSDLCLEMHVPLKSPTDKLCLLRCSIPHSIPASTFVHTRRSPPIGTPLTSFSPVQRLIYALATLSHTECAENCSHVVLERAHWTNPPVNAQVSYRQFFRAASAGVR
jgi:hypothetical protein